MTLEERANRVVGRYDAAVSAHTQAVAELSRATHEAAVTEQAQTILEGIAAQRRGEALGLLSWSATQGVSQVFGDHLSVVLGDPDGEGLAASTRVMLVDRGYLDAIEESSGRSGYNIAEFCIWLQMTQLLRAVRPNMSPLVFWDEPFVNLKPDNMGYVRDILSGCADLGLQLVVATNHEQMIPDCATVVEIGE